MRRVLARSLRSSARASFSAARGALRAHGLGRVWRLVRTFAQTRARADPHTPVLALALTRSGGSAAGSFLQPYLDGEKACPLPTYFVGDFGGGAEVALAAAGAPDETGAVRVAPNLFCLRGARVAERHGLRVASLSGRYDALLYGDTSTMAAADVAARGGTYLKAMVDKLCVEARGGTGVDLLLTAEWPEGVGAGATAAPTGAPTGEAAARQLVVQIAPRYHVVGGSEGVSWVRAPYVNGGGGVTRFVALAAVSAPPPAKWLHALAIEPSAGMDAAKRNEVPAGATKSPYDMPAPPGPPPGVLPPQLAGVPPPGPPPVVPGGQEGGWRFQNVGADGSTRGGGGAGGRRGTKRPRPAAAEPSSLGGGTQVFVRNLAPGQVSEDALKDLFEGGGCLPVTRVKLGTKQGKPAGFAHVDFGSNEAAVRALAMHGTMLMGREVFVEAATGGRGKAEGAPPPLSVAGAPPPAPADCWFCLSNESAQLHLVVSVAEQAYMALDKGPMVPQHVLVIPIEHVPCAAALSPAAYAEVEQYLGALARCFAERLAGSKLVCFERFLSLRGKGGNHCHINCLPVPADEADSVRQVFETKAAKAGFKFEAVLPPGAPQAALQQAAAGAEYFCVRLPDGTRLVHRMARGERHPMTFGRETIAAALGKPDRAAWKSCSMGSEEEETKVTNAFKEVFADYDPTQQ